MRKLMEGRVQSLLEHHDMGDIHLTHREEEFLQDIIDRVGGPDTELTVAQEDWVNVLYDRYILNGVFK